MRDQFTDEGALSAIDAWAHVAGDPLALRVFTSRLIGSEPSLVLHGGGNTSVKAPWTDLFGQPVEALWIKGSGWNLATIEPAGFTPVDLAFVRRLRELDRLSDEDMVGALQTHKLVHTAPSPSIETLLHAFLPHTFIDHSHADAILALTNLDDGASVVREALGSDVAIVPYVKPGFDLSKLAAEAYEAQPDCIGLVLLHHGLFTFGDTAKESYQRHIELVRRAESHLVDAASRATFVPLGRGDDRAADQPRAARVANVLRGCLGALDPAGAPVMAFRDDEELLTAMQSPQLPHWGRSGPLTPDHVIRTKPHPLLVLEVDPDASLELLTEGLQDAVRTYAERYDAYVEGCAARAGGIESYTRLAPAPRVVWYPGVGLFTAGADARSARIAADIARHTLLVKAQASALGPYVGLDAQHLFDMEYWSLEQAKLGRASPPPLARRVAVVTGGAGAVGVGIARQLLAAGAQVVLTDVSEPALERAREELGATDALHTVVMDVTSTSHVARGLDEATLAFGGIDTWVLNAGIAVAGELSELTDDALDRAVSVNVTGTHRVLREAARRLAALGSGGDVVLVSSKTVPSPGQAFGGYSATKAAAHQLARVAALELAPLGVRVNMVAPDAVFAEGSVPSGLWAQIGPERAAARGLSPDQLPGFYQERNLLKAPVTGSDVGRAVVFFVSRQTPTTGAVLPVDGGIPAAFPR